MTKKKRILIGMSGGIDSTVAAILLMEQGYELVGATFRTFDPCHNADNKGCGSEDSVMAALSITRAWSPKSPRDEARAVPSKRPKPSSASRMTGLKSMVEKSVFRSSTTTTALPDSERFLATSYIPSSNAESRAAPTHILSENQEVSNKTHRQSHACHGVKCAEGNAYITLLGWCNEIVLHAKNRSKERTTEIEQP